MVIDEIVNNIRPYATSLGYGGMIGTATLLALSAGRGMRRGTTFRQQLGSATNIAVSTGVGVLSALLSHGNNHSSNTLEEAVPYVGSVCVGAVAGGLVNPFYNALRTTDGIIDRYAERFRQGAVTGAITFPIGYGILDLASRHF